MNLLFWEHNYQRAVQWARQNSTDEAYVLGAYLDLKEGLDLLSSDGLDQLVPVHEDLKSRSEIDSFPMPQNKGVDRFGTPMLRNLDCAVIQNYKRIAKSEGVVVNSVRGVFWEGGELYQGSGFSRQNHIQVSVDESCVIGTFRTSECMEEFGA